MPRKPEPNVAGAAEATAQKSQGNKAAKKKGKTKGGRDKAAGSSSGGGGGRNGPRNGNLVDELKVFQNTNLIHQQDPMEQLQQQLSQIIQDNEHNGTSARTGAHQRLLRGGTQLVGDQARVHHLANGSLTDQQTSLSSTHTHSNQQQSQPSALQQRHSPYYHQNDIATENGFIATYTETADSNNNMLTIKKGVVCYRAQSRRLFQRWKKRYIILTPNSIFFFKKSTSKVGHSEMGKFINKTSLGDITKTQNLKGVIVLYTRDEVNFYLRSKESSEWISLIDASIERLRERGACNQNAVCRLPTVDAPMGQTDFMDTGALIRNGATEGFYENAVPPTQGRVSKLMSADGDGNGREFRLINDAGTKKIETSGSDGAALRQTLASAEINSCAMEQQREADGNQRHLHANGRASSDVSPPMRSDAPAHPEESVTGPPQMINGDGAPVDDGPAKELSEDGHCASGEPVAKRTSGPGAAECRPRLQLGKRTQVGQSAQSSVESSSSSPSSSSSSSTARKNKADHLEGKESPHATFESAANSESGNDKLASELAGASEGQRERANRACPESGLAQGGAQDSDHLASVQSHEPRASTQRADIELVGKQQRPLANTNLIRRDDSWQSLVSLTRAGEQVQGAHLAQAMDRNGFGGQRRPRRIPSIDSTATPMRNKPTRQQSLQAYPGRLPLLSELKQQNFRHHLANSFDAAQIPSSPSLQYNHQSQYNNNSNNNSNNKPYHQAAQPQTPTSYHQKLMQLQLLHNSNNIDYIRNGNSHGGGFQPTGAGNLATGYNDYQIYGPESIATTNHYGYYSMRSNLKSAASEFSFIRPSSSSNQSKLGAGPSGQKGQPAAQPPPPPTSRTGFALTNRASSDERWPHALPAREMAASPGANVQYLLQGPVAWRPPDQQPPPIPAAGMQISTPLNQHQKQGLVHPALAVGDLAAPNRELPLKPNKKRQQAHALGQVTADGRSAQRASSSGSGLVRFLKRAFSKRSKRRPKLAMSCSPSVMEADFASQALVGQSAFSTGSNQEYQSERASAAATAASACQQQRMIDLVEAFANKTALDEATYQRHSRHRKGGFDADPQPQVSTLQRHAPPFGATRLRASGSSRHSHLMFASPQLHKSNSISTSNGFGMLGTETARSRHEIAGLVADAQASCYTPLVSRSTKVMSANLTPVFSRRADLAPGAPGRFASPRHSINLAEQQQQQPPRPSSIYGQPSMISSPLVIASNGTGGQNFAVHNSNGHANHHASAGGRGHGVGVEFRRGQPGRSSAFSHLDTTREVAEELSSPTADSESKTFDVAQELGQTATSYQIDANGNLVLGSGHASPRMPPAINGHSRAGIGRHHERQAIVNPILQSPTMSFIYDNYPSVRARPCAPERSHYDNSHAMDYAQRANQYHPPNSVSSMELSTRLAETVDHPSVPHINATAHFAEGPRSPFAVAGIAATKRPNRSRQSYNSDDQGGVDFSPARQIRLSQQQQQQQLLLQQQPQLPDALAAGSFVGPAWAVAHGKPAAIVTPHTPCAERRVPESNYARADATVHPGPAARGVTEYTSARAPSGSVAAISPMASPRSFINQQPQYHRSPLVDGETRVLKRGERGVQATVMGVSLDSTATPSQRRRSSQASISKHFGNTNGPALASTSNRQSEGGPAMANLSAHEGPRSFETPNGRGDPSHSVNGLACDKPSNGRDASARVARSGSRDDDASLARSTASPSADHVSSSASSTATKSSGRSRKAHDKSADSFGAIKERRVNPTPSDQKVAGSDSRPRPGRRGSSSEHSDELSSQAGSIDEPDERNWVNSKLAH